METTPSSSPVIEKKLTRKVHTWRTNFNNKMACDWIVHIDLAPTAPPQRAWMDETVIEIRTEDQSHPSIERKLDDMLIMELQQINDYLSYPSHGMGAISLINHFYVEYPERMNPKTKMAVYYYKPVYDTQQIDQIYKTA